MVLRCFRKAQVGGPIPPVGSYAVKVHVGERPLGKGKAVGSTPTHGSDAFVAQWLCNAFVKRRLRVQVSPKAHTEVCQSSVDRAPLLRDAWQHTQVQILALPHYLG